MTLAPLHEGLWGYRKSGYCSEGQGTAGVGIHAASLNEGEEKVDGMGAAIAEVKALGMALINIPCPDAKFSENDHGTSFPLARATTWSGASLTKETTSMLSSVWS